MLKIKYILIISILINTSIGCSNYSNKKSIDYFSKDFIWSDKINSIKFGHLFFIDSTIVKNNYNNLDSNLVNKYFNIIANEYLSNDIRFKSVFNYSIIDTLYKCNDYKIILILEKINKNLNLNVVFDGVIPFMYQDYYALKLVIINDNEIYSVKTVAEVNESRDYHNTSSFIDYSFSKIETREMSTDIMDPGTLSFKFKTTIKFIFNKNKLRYEKVDSVLQRYYDPSVED